jgi:hypothetical protein
VCESFRTFSHISFLFCDFRETLSSHRSQRSTSYCGSVTPTQPLSSRRSSLVTSTATSTSAQPPSTPSNEAQVLSETLNLQQSFINKINLFNQSTINGSNTTPPLPLPNNNSGNISATLTNNSNNPNSNSSLVKARLSPSTLKRQSKRFSSPVYSDSNNERFGTKEKNGRSTNETIEIMAEQVTEENVVSRAYLKFSALLVECHLLDLVGEENIAYKFLCEKTFFFYRSHVYVSMCYVLAYHMGIVA